MTQNNLFTIATYNIQFGVNREKVLANITQMANDNVGIFCLQEIINVSGEEFIIDSILKKLGKDWEAKFHVGSEISKLSIGTAIIWNTKLFSFKKQEKILLPKIKKFDVHETFFYKVIGVPDAVLQRKAISCTFRYNQTDIRVTSVHIDNVGGPVHRMKQMSYLISKLRTSEAPKHEIISGDFNTFDLLKTGYEKKILQKEIGQDFIDASKDINWSSDIYMMDFRTSIKFFPWIIKTFNIHIRRRLDYIWVKNFIVKECKKLELTGSDHFPITAILELPEDK
jgi:endonuclease/exonuclease/phosphatase family metal-dependent hydrolase